MQTTSLPKPNDAQKIRMQIIQDLGCIACLLGKRRVGTEAEIHHQLSGGVRISHWHTVALCCWHHRAAVPVGLTEQLCRQRRGPSFAQEPNAFREAYGDDEELLAKQNECLKKYCMHIGLKAHLKKIVEAQSK